MPAAPSRVPALKGACLILSKSFNTHVRAKEPGKSTKNIFIWFGIWRGDEHTFLIKKKAREHEEKRRQKSKSAE
jgi:hypothetical protein